MRHLVIIGVGGFSRDVYIARNYYLGYGSEWDMKGFIDGEKVSTESEYAKLKLPVLGSIFDYDIQEDDVFLCAIGDPFAKKRVAEMMVNRGAKFLTMIHSTAKVYDVSVLGNGCYVGEYSVITDSVTIGDFVSILINVTVSHDCSIGSYSTIVGHVAMSGYSKVGECAYVGSNASILPYAKVGFGAYVGAGSVVLRSVKNRTKVFGNPAVPL